MTDYFENLPGDCFVQQITQDPKGISITPNLLAGFGFLPSQSATILFIHGNIIITNIPEQQAIIKGIEELQLRQDEKKADFTAAITELSKAVRP